MPGETHNGGILVSRRQREKVTAALNALALRLYADATPVPADLWAQYKEALLIIAAPATTAPLHD